MNPRRSIPLAALALAGLLGWVFVHERDLQTSRRISIDRLKQRELSMALSLEKARANLKDIELQSLSLTTDASPLNAEQRQTAEWIKLIERRLHVWLELSNAALYRKLGWNRDKVEAYEKLATARWIQIHELETDAEAEGLGSSDEGLQSSKAQANHLFDQAVSAAVGDSEAQQIKIYNRTGAARGYIAEIATHTYYTDSPLTAGQSDQLESILESNSPNFLRGETLSTYSLNWPAALAQASQILLPVQFEALKNAVSTEQTNYKFWEAMYKGMGQPFPPKAAPTRAH